ncbi:MAG: hypothetical protein IPH77_14490 [Ignavibacteria bacterium]|nr:hypothetical protein [Ignavibacteria bacterium]
MILICLYGNNGLGSAGPEIGLLRNTGGIFSNPEIIPTTIFAGGIRDIETADLNNDGWNDIVTANANARVTDGYQVRLLRMKTASPNCFSGNNAAPNTKMLWSVTWTMMVRLTY